MLNEKKSMEDRATIPADDSRPLGEQAREAAGDFVEVDGPEAVQEMLRASEKLLGLSEGELVGTIIIGTATKLNEQGDHEQFITGNCDPDALAEILLSTAITLDPSMLDRLTNLALAHAMDSILG